MKEGELLIGFFIDPVGNRLSMSDGFVELIAWDRTKRLFNYWELIGTRWRYRGDSDLDACRKAGQTQAAVEGWLRHAHGQRRAIDEAETSQHPLGGVIETGFREIFPSQRDQPRKLRLNPATCLAEPQP